MERTRAPSAPADDEVAVGVGAEIIDAEGPIGRVAGFLAHPSEGRITHVVLRHGRPVGAAHGHDPGRAPAGRRGR